MKELSLKAIRVNNGWSLEEASALIGISKDTLSKYERGETYPDILTVKRIEDVYQINIFTDTVKFFLPTQSETIGKQVT